MLPVMAATALASPPGDPPREDHFVHLRDVTWADYRRILEVRGERSSPRIAFLEGTLELMTPSKEHESIKSVIGCLVEVWCGEHEVDFSPYGSWTLEGEAVERAVEPDECYVFGNVAEPERPDLAIEVIWTRGGIGKLEIYRKLGVREVWIWRRGKIEPHVLRGERYEVAARSEVLPEIDLEHLATFLDRKPTSRAMRDYRDSLRGAATK
jgi:Uma2 family endonuclease